MILLARLGPSLRATAEPDGLWFRSAGKPECRLHEPSGWPAGALDEPRGLLAALQIEQLCRLALAEPSASGMRIPYDRFPALREARFTLPRLWAGASPFRVSVSTCGSLERGPLAYRCQFFHGEQEVLLRRVGRYCMRVPDGPAFLLDDFTCALLEYLDDRRPPAEDTGAALDRLIGFAFIRTYGREAGACLDRYLQDNQVIFPSAVDVCEPRRSPDLRELPGEFARVFWSLPQARRQYCFRARNGGWAHVVFDDRQLEVLRRLRNVPPWLPPAGLQPAAPAPAPAVTTRSGCFEGQTRVVPVLPIREPRPTAVPEPDGSPSVYEADIQQLPPDRLEALAACLYEKWGFSTVLMPEDNHAGAAVVAVQDDRMVLVHVCHGSGTVPAREALEGLLAAQCSYQRFFSRPFRLALVARTAVEPELHARARRLRIALKDGIAFAQDVESEGISREAVWSRARDRCVSFQDGLERIRFWLHESSEQLE